MIFTFPLISNFAFHVLNVGDPGGACIIISTTGITSPIEITAIMITTHKPHLSVHFGVGAALSSTSAIGNSVSPLGALTIKLNTMYTTMMTEIISNVPPIASRNKYGLQPAAVALSKYVENDVLLGAPNRPTVCIAPDIKNIPTIQRIICQIANLFIAGVIIRFDRCGTNQ